MNKELRKQYMRRFFKNNKGTVFLAGLAALLSSSANVALSAMLQQFIDQIAQQAELSSLRLLTACLLGLIVYAELSILLEAFSATRFLQKAMVQYKEYVMAQLLKKNLSSFRRESSAGYISALTNDALQIETDYLKNLFRAFELIVTGLGALVLMLFYNPLLSVIAITLSLLPLAISLATGRRLTPKAVQVSEKNQSYVASVQDILLGFSVIKSFRAEKDIFRLYQKENRSLEKAKFERNQTEYSIKLFATFGALFAQLGVMLAGAWISYHDASLTAGMILAFTNLMNFVIGPIRSLPELLAKRKTCLALIDKLANRLEHNVREAGEMLEKPLRDGIRVQDLHYAYEKSAPVLDGLQCHFEAGKSYALVGGSGSGKSTLLQLLMGADSNYDGHLQIDGLEIRDIQSDSLYAQISMIQQNVFLFNGSVRDNLTLFHPVDEDRLTHAMKQAGLEEFLGDKNQRPVGENGQLLSGGQKQRISIARSLLQDASILLVDEATSSLDNANAQKVTQSILDLDDILRIVVTHRLEKKLLEQYDAICVLKNGKIIEKGTFQELMDRKEAFYSLYMVSQ